MGTNLGEVRVGQQLEIGLKAGIMDDFPVLFLFKRPPE